jgi:hypothetical protein
MNNTIDAQNNVGKQTDDARSYLGNRFHLYKGYINSTLAGDFAFNLAKQMQKADAEIELKRSQLLNMDKLVMSIQDERDKLLEVTLAMREYIDAIPKDLVLPAMPGFDRDWADEIIDRCKDGS